MPTRRSAPARKGSTSAAAWSTRSSSRTSCGCWPRPEQDRGALDRARVLSDEALELARTLEVPLLLLCTLEVRGSVHLDEGEVDQARLLLEEAERLGAESSVPGSYLSEALRLLGRLDAEAGDINGARARLTAALDLAQSVQDPWAERRAAADLDQLARDVEAP